MSEEKPRGTASEMTYEVGSTLDVLHLSQLAEEWHSYVCGPCPGAEIESITYARTDHRLVVTFR